MAKAILPQHQEFLDEHFSVAPQWEAFHDKLKDPEFTTAVRQDSRSNPKLKRFAKMVGLRQSSQSAGVSVPSDSSGSYRVRYHPEADRFSCTCPDWTYKRSVKYRGAGSDCKHINRLKSRAKEKAIMKVASLPVIRIIHRVAQDENRREETEALKQQNKVFRAHFPQKSLVAQFFKEAQIRGAAARALIEK